MGDRSDTVPDINEIDGGPLHPVGPETGVLSPKVSSLESVSV